MTPNLIGGGSEKSVPPAALVVRRPAIGGLLWKNPGTPLEPEQEKRQEVFFLWAAARLFSSHRKKAFD